MTVLVFKRHYVSPCAGLYDEPGCCDHCGGELVPAGTPKRYCDASCHQAIQTLPIEERAERRAAAALGTCVNCGASLPQQYRCPRARNAWLKRWRRAAGGTLRFGPEAYEWLAGKLGLDPSDERLPQIALRLATHGRLAVLINRDGQVVGIAKARQDNGSMTGQKARER